jgi:uncharacterized membrane protein
MPVDVCCEIEIARPRAEVSAFAGDLDNTTLWYENIEVVAWRSPKPAAVGSRVEFTARFLGRRLTYTYEILELVPGRRLRMAASGGPFPMETTYTWDDAPRGATTMTLRNRGEPSAFFRIAAPLLERAMRRANGKDLARLRELLERGVR